VILAALTGGIGSGKSTVSALLARRGAVIVDADAVTRLVQEPGSPVLDKLAERFGGGVITESGMLDRAALAAIAFADAGALKDLNSIVHPAVATEMNRQVLAQRETDHVVVMDIPLLTENPRDGVQARIVVDVPVELQVERLIKFRGFAEDDARARIGRQSSREDRLKLATHVIDNSGTIDDLEPQVDALWNELQALPQLPPDWDFPPRAPRDDAAVNEVTT
jgi:dephospho-CoA kinase